MNWTFTSLTLSSFSHSPFYMSSIMKHFHKFEIFNTNYHHSLSGFINSINSNNNKLKIYHSRFNYILNNVITFNSQDIFGQLYNSNSSLTTKEHNLNVKSSVFRHIWCNEGGAIMINDPYCISLISNTGFAFCNSAANGAGIDYEGLILNISRCCFFGCMATQSGQGFYFYGKSAGKDIPYCNIEYTSIEQCSPLQQRGARESIFLSHGLETVQFINSTSNHIIEFGSCFVSAYTYGIGLHYSNFLDCTGENCFWFHNTRREDCLEKCNVIHNSAKKETGLFAFENGTTIISEFIFKNNHGSVYFVTGPVILKNCVFDIQQSSFTFYHCVHECINVTWANKDFTSYPLPKLITWQCWGFGKPSPTASKSLPPIEYVQEMTISGISVFIVVMIIGFISGISVFSICNNTKEKIQMSGIQSVAISNY